MRARFFYLKRYIGFFMSWMTWSRYERQLCFLPPRGALELWLHRVKSRFHSANSFLSLLLYLNVLILNFQTKKSLVKNSKNWWRNSNFTSTLCTFLFYFLILKWGLSGINKIIKNNFQKKNQFFLQICHIIDPFRDFGAKKKSNWFFSEKWFTRKLGI